LRTCSRKISDRERSKSPWYLLALIFEEGLNIKKKESISPRNTPRKINTEKISI